LFRLFLYALSGFGSDPNSRTHGIQWANPNRSRVRNSSVIIPLRSSPMRPGEMPRKNSRRGGAENTGTTAREGHRIRMGFEPAGTSLKSAEKPKSCSRRSYRSARVHRVMQNYRCSSIAALYNAKLAAVELFLPAVERPAAIKALLSEREAAFRSRRLEVRGCGSPLVRVQPTCIEADRPLRAASPSSAGLPPRHSQLQAQLKLLPKWHGTRYGCAHAWPIPFRTYPPLILRTLPAT